MSTLSPRNHAVVIGGSIAGLFAARVLSEHFARVTLIERDLAPDDSEPRKGVPQGRQVHAILTPSYKAIRELFPGLVEEMVAEGASIFDAGNELAIILNGCWAQRVNSDLDYIACTRPFYEAKIRSRVRALPNAALRMQRRVDSLVDDGNGHITGVDTQDVANGERERIDADFVVDASGRATGSPRWLEVLGYGAPPVEAVGIDLTYVSALYEAPIGFRAAATMYAIYPDPPSAWHGGFMQTVEGSRWIVSLWGLFGDRAPLDDAGFIEFSRTLASHEVHDFLRTARRTTELKAMKIPVNRWYRYDRMSRFPGNFCVVGDAVSSLNPVYGQGMTKAAIQALYLRRLLRENVGRDSIARVALRLRKGLPAAIERQAWMTTSYGDLVYPQATGKRPPDFRFVTWYTRCIAELASTDPAVRVAFHRAYIFEDGMYALFQPRIFAKVLAFAARRPFVRRERLVNTGPMPKAAVASK